MSELQATLEDLGLHEYQYCLVKHGFDTWDNLAGIKEKDMAALGIKLGHRRRLQRENARRLGHPAKEPLSNPQARAQNTTEDRITRMGRPNKKCGSQAQRRPRVAPKSDSGYVAYARFLCQDPKVSNLSLVETAKLVGERWSILPSDIRDMWNTSSAEQKGTDDSQLAHYGQTATCRVCDCGSKSGKLRQAQCEAKVNRSDALPENRRPHYQSDLRWSRGNAQAYEKSITSEFIRQYLCELAQDSSNSSRTQDLDTIGNSTPIFYETPAIRSEYKVDNVFDRGSNTKVEHEIEVDIKCDSELVEMTDVETLDFSQFVNDDIRSAGFCRSPSCLFDNSPSDFVSTINSYHATTPGLLSLNTANDVKPFSRIATPCLYTGKEMGTNDSQNISGDHQHGQSGLSEAPRQLCPEPIEAECPPSSSTVNQQTPLQTSTDFRSFSSFSPANPPAKLLKGAPILDEPSQNISTSNRQCKNGVNSGRIQKLLAKKGRGSRKVRSYAKEEVAAKRDDFLARNRQTAYKCREKRKAWVTHLVEREEFFTKNNAQLPYEIEKIRLELKDLRAIAVEHYKFCPIPSPELVLWFEKEVQHSKTPTSNCHARGPPTPPPQDADYVDPDRQCLSASEVDLVKLNPIPILASQIWPSFPTHFSRAPEPLPQNCYVKRPGLLYYSGTETSTDLSSLLLKEAHVCEILRAYPHPNIAQYLGCIVENGKITGLCFVKYGKTLSERMAMGCHPVDTDAFFRGIENGIRHLHSLGLIHCDLNPTNILTNGDTPVIGAFDSCQWEGDVLGFMDRTRGWTNEDLMFALPENDHYRLSMIREFLYQAKYAEQLISFPFPT